MRSTRRRGDGVCVGPAGAGRPRSRSAPLDATASRPGRAPTAAGVTGEIVVSRAVTQGPLRPAVGHRARAAPRAGLAPHRRRRPPRRRGPAVGRGPAGARRHAPPTARSRRSGVEQRVEALTAWPRGLRRRRARPAPRSWSWSSCRRTGPGGTGSLADLAWRRPSGRPPAVPVAAVLVRSDAARRHPAQLQDRPGRAGPLGQRTVLVVTSRAREGPGHRRRGCSGGAVGAALAARGDEVTVLQRRPAGLGLREVLGDVTDPGRARRRSPARRGGPPRRQGRRGRRLGRLRRGQRRGHRAPSSTAARAAGASRLVHVSSPSVAHAGDSLVGAPAGPADPEHARGPYAAARRWPSCSPSPRTVRGFAVLAVRPHLVWGPGDTQLVGRIVERARAGTAGAGRRRSALIDTTYVDNAADALVAALDHAETAGAGPRRLQRPAAPGRRDPRLDLRGRRRARARSGTCPPRSAWAAGAVVDSRWARPRPRGRPADDPVPRRAAGHRPLVRPAPYPRRPSLGAHRSTLDEGFARLAASYTA